MTLLWHRSPSMVEHAHATQADLEACEITHQKTLQNLGDPTMNQSTVRTLRDIAADIRADWPRMTERLDPSLAWIGGGEHPARPYVDAMAAMSGMDDHYGYDSAREVVLRFLDAASTWRGAKAREIKAELRGML